MENNVNNNSLTRLELSDALVREVGLSRHESMQLVDDVLDHLSNSLALGENVKISSFGTFSCRQKKERIGRNPKTGIEAPIIARKVVTFKPSQIMKDKINKVHTKFYIFRHLNPKLSVSYPECYTCQLISSSCSSY